MIKQTEFAWLVKDALMSIHDYAALETHPLSSLLPRGQDIAGSRAEHLRSVLIQTIERLRPVGLAPSSQAVQWRPYLILHGRYVEGLSLQELQTRLSLSARQLTREHHRALGSIVSLLHSQIAPAAAGGQWQPAEPPDAELPEDIGAFEAAREVLHLDEVVRSVATAFAGRGFAHAPRLHVAMADQLPSIQADRIVLRQILFTMLGYALRLYPDGDVTISAQVHPERVVLCGRARPASPAALPAVLDDAPLHIARFWAQRFGAKLTIQRGSQGDDSVQLLLSWPRAEQPVVMVVDDQEPAIRLFQRYLSRASVRVVGVREPEQVLPMARKLRPAVITLDVMMPTTDGWEVLQSILSDPDTRHIPVVICSVWDEPELALSFGATAFLKKPITQRDLLDALQRLSIVDRPGAQSSVNN